MGWYRFCRRIGFINNIIFQKSNAFNLVLVLLPLYVLTIFLSYILKVYYGFNYEAAQLIIYFSFVITSFIFRPMVLMIYNRYYFKWDILRSLRYFFVDLIKFVKETQWFESCKLILAYFAYAFFSACSIFLYIDGLIGKIFPQIARTIFVDPVLNLTYNHQNIEIIYIIIYLFFIVVLAYPLISIVESSLRNVHPKWRLYSINQSSLSFIVIIVIMIILPELFYFNYLEQDDIRDLDKITHDEFSLLKNSMINRLEKMFTGTLFVIILVIIIIDDYRMTKLYLRSKKNMKYMKFSTYKSSLFI